MKEKRIKKEAEDAKKGRASRGSGENEKSETKRGGFGSVFSERNRVRKEKLRNRGGEQEERGSKRRTRGELPSGSS